MMKCSSKASMAALAIATMLGGIAPAYADNAGVEDAIRSRPDLSTFYQALINTGVNHELQEGRSYTIFAPTNEAFAHISQNQYPCFYMTECREQVAAIVRDHIVPGKVYVNDAINQQGGVNTISGHFIRAGKVARLADKVPEGDFAIAGNNVVYQSEIGNGMLYKIDGVIADKHVLDAMVAADYAYMTPASGAAVAVAPAGTDRVTQTTTERVIEDPACGPGGCPDRSVTTITHSVDAPEMVHAQ